MSRKKTVVALLCGGVVLVALGVLFFVLGLEKADQVSSVIGGLSGLIGLALAVVGLWSARRQDQQRQPDRQGIEEPEGERDNGIVVDMRIERQLGEATGAEAKNLPSGGAQVTMDIGETGTGSRTIGYREI